jgi:hypothetical protein
MARSIPANLLFGVNSMGRALFAPPEGRRLL